MTAIRSPSTTPKRQRRWFQFSLGMLMLLVFLFGIPASFVGVRLQMARNKRVLAAQFRGGDVGFRELGGLFSSDVSVASIYFSSLTDADLRSLQEPLERQPDLQVLVLGGTQISDAGLVPLRGLKQLLLLNLNDTQVTDAGLVHLHGLTRLQYLSLDNTRVTDAGLVHLQGLTQLKTLSLANTPVTDAGRAKLQKALPNVEIGR